MRRATRGFGDRLEITHHYAWRAAKYLCTDLQGPCRAAADRSPGVARTADPG